MKKIDKITTLGKMMLKDKITSSCDKLLTEKPQGDLMGFYKKRLEHFLASAGFRKKLSSKRRLQSHMRQWKKLMFYLKIKATNRCRRLWDRMHSRSILREASSSRPIAAYIHIPFCKIRCTICSFFKQCFFNKSRSRICNQAFDRAGTDA